MAAKEKDLEPVTDRKVIDRYIRYAVDFKEIASCTTEGPSPSVSFSAHLRDYQAAAFTLNLEIRDEEFADLNYEQRAALDIPERPLRISFSVNDVLFFAHTRVFARQDKKLALAIDLPVFKLQRREAVRIKIMKEHQASVELNGKKFIPHDVSASGLSIVMDAEEKDRYGKGFTFETSVVRFAGKEYRPALEVAGVHPLRKDSDRLWKVGFRFRNLPAAAADAIAREAYLYTQKIWSRWL